MRPSRPPRILTAAVAKRAIDDLRKLSLEYRWRLSGVAMRLKLIASVASWPLRVLVPAWRAVYAYGPSVARLHGVPPRRQFAQLWALAACHRFLPDDYYRYRMYLVPFREASLFLSQPINLWLRRRLYERLMVDRTPLTDKRAFYRICRENGLPPPDTVAEFDRGTIRWWSGAALPRCDLFVKEAAGSGGAGAARWDYDGVSRWVGEARQVLDERGLLEHLCRLSSSARLIIQRRVENHPEVGALGPAGLCTVRVVTLRDPCLGHIRVLLASFRMPTGGDVADNFGRGGLGCSVDLTTGELGPATYKSPALAHADLHAHPDTGARIAGRRLPFWDEVIALALCAHRTLPQFPSVGWDVAISPAGPILLEGNYNWCVVLAQQAGFRPLGGSHYADEYLAWQRRGRDSSVIPRPRAPERPDTAQDIPL